jgi:hypothetical protein
MPRRVAPRPAPTAEALYDRYTGKLWIEYPGGDSVQIGSASNTNSAYGLLNVVGLAPAGSWISSYGSLRSCLVVVPDGWSLPAIG